MEQTATLKWQHVVSTYYRRDPFHLKQAAQDVRVS